MAFSLPMVIPAAPSAAATGRSRTSAKKLQDHEASCFDEILKKAASEGDDPSSANLAASQFQTSTTPRASDFKPEINQHDVEDQNRIKTENTDASAKPAETSAAVTQTGATNSVNNPSDPSKASPSATTGASTTTAVDSPAASSQAESTMQSTAAQAIQTAQGVDPAALQAALTSQPVASDQPQPAQPAQSAQTAAAAQVEASAAPADPGKVTAPAAKTDIQNTQAAGVSQSGQPAAEQPAIVIPVQGISSSDSPTQAAKQPTPVPVNIKAKGVDAEAAPASNPQADTQPAATNPAAAAGQTPVQASSSQAVGSSAKAAETTAADIIRQIVSHTDDISKATRPVVHIQLFPEELGKIDLKVSSGSHGIAITLTADQSSTSKMLETHLGSLRQALADAGVQLNNLGMGSSGGNLGQAKQQGQTFQTRFQPQNTTSDLKAETVTPVKENIKSSSMVDYRI